MYAQGHLLFARGTTLVARPFDARRLAFTGEELPVAEQILLATTNNSWVFSVSANGVLVYQSGGVSALHLTWLDRAGKRVGTVGPTLECWSERLQECDQGKLIAWR
jgi:hypothetical protein